VAGDRAERGAVAPEGRSVAGDRAERGAAAVESVLVTPLLVLLVFGIIELGAIFYDWTMVRSSVSDAAREGSASGSSPRADHAVLRHVRLGSSKFIGRIEGVVVFRATSPDDRPTPACVTAARTGGPGVAGVCNVYRPSDLVRPASDFGRNPAVDPTAIDRFWQPISRVDWLTGPPDLVGVTVVLEHPALSGVFPAITFQETSIIPIEPRRSSL
jgi:hypothetical protein